MPKEKRTYKTEKKVRIEGKNKIIKYDKETFTRTNSPRRSYNYLMGERCRKHFENKVKDANSNEKRVFYTGRRHKFAFGKYSSEAIKDFRKFYGKEYEEGYQNYIKNGIEGLKDIYCLLENKLEINFIGESTKPFEYKIK